jgi:hypothetical protein
MKIKKWTIILLSVFFYITCSKTKDEVPEMNFSRMILVITPPFYHPTFDSVVIDLNNNSTVKSVIGYRKHLGEVTSSHMTDFYFKPFSLELDSSYTTTRILSNDPIFSTTRYLYENGKLIKSSEFCYVSGDITDSVIYSYNLEGRIADIYRYGWWNTEQQYVSHSKFEYIGDNLSSLSINHTNVIPGVYNWICYDDKNKINPFNRLFEKNGYPFLSYYLPWGSTFCSNNPTKIVTSQDTITLGYKYNKFNYPIEIISNTDIYNSKIIYEN